MPISYENCQLGPSSCTQQCSSKKKGFAWVWPKSALTEPSVKLAMMKDIVVECPETTVPQPPLPRYDVFFLSSLTLFRPVFQEMGLGEIKPSFFLAGLRLIWEAEGALPHATNR